MPCENRFENSIFWNQKSLSECFQNVAISKRPKRISEFSLNILRICFSSKFTLGFLVQNISKDISEISSRMFWECSKMFFGVTNFWRWKFVSLSWKEQFFFRKHKIAKLFILRNIFEREFWKFWFLETIETWISDFFLKNIDVILKF